MSRPTDPVQRHLQARSHFANTIKAARKQPTPAHEQAVAEAHRLLIEARIERHILEGLREEPALSTEQRLYLANLLVVSADLTLDQRNHAASLLCTTGALR